MLVSSKKNFKKTIMKKKKHFLQQSTPVPYEDGLATPKGILDSSTPFTLFFSPGPNSLFQNLQPSKAKAVEQYA